MKIKRQISQKATKRFTWMCTAAVGMMAVNYVTKFTTDSMIEEMWGVDAADEGVVYEGVKYNTSGEGMYSYTDDEGSAKFKWKDTDYENYAYIQRQQGWVEEFYDGDMEGDYCYSGLVLIPGTTLLPKGLLGFAYFMFLGFLFLGISIVADIFMEAIEVITSQTVLREQPDPETGKLVQVEVQVWNATIANLTLMALGSSAPEILLSVIEALGTLGKPAGPLGASTIVGSAAFNLLVISAVAVVAVDEPKKILDTGVFATTALFSIFAYLWLYICLVVQTPGIVTTTEAWLTIIYFVILCAMAFIADRVFAAFQQKNMDKDTIESKKKEEQVSLKRNELRQFSKQLNGGDQAVMEVAQGISSAYTKAISEQDKNAIIKLYQEILNCKDVSKQSAKDLHSPLLPTSLLEKFAARKANNFGGHKDFLELQGTKGQIENAVGKIEQENEQIGFKCLHYSVTESSGYVEITVVKKMVNTDVSFGIRTVDSTAKSPADFTSYDEVYAMKKRETEFTFQINIIDNQEWQPDLEFMVELYDPTTNNKHFGDDTQTKVTILDEDFPGKLGFAATEIQASKFQERVDIKIVRSEGSSGKISCMVRTEQLTESGRAAHNSAAEFDDYLPKHDKVEFENQENEKTISITLVNDKMVPRIEGKTGGNQVDEDDMDVEQNSQQEEVSDVMFKIVLEKADPAEVKISKKNVCVVTIVQSELVQKEQDQASKLMGYFLESQEITWGQQFLEACKCGPAIDSDDLIVSDVTLFEALFHFGCIGWKVLFATIPPSNMGKGMPAFCVALAYIGIITMFVGEVATILGCSIGLKASVTAITLVALGTSLPDTFASKTAAQQSPYADSAVGNVTGSNCVNVFLGLGLPWVISTQYQAKREVPFEVPAGDLAFSVAMYLMTSICCFIILIARRFIIGGELGGPKTSAYASAALLVSLWFIYVLFSTLKAYGVIGADE